MIRPFVRLFFGRICSSTIWFRDLLTFNSHHVTYIYWLWGALWAAMVHPGSYNWWPLSDNNWGWKKIKCWPSGAEAAGGRHTVGPNGEKPPEIRLNFLISVYIVGSALKSCLIQKWNFFFFKLASIFFGGVKNWVFLGLAVLVIE